MNWFLKYMYPILFGLSYSQSPLFSSNQNTKFISGLSAAGYEDLTSDWMSGITDSFPLFSYILKIQYEIFGLYFGVHGMFLLLVSLYGSLGVYIANDFLGNIKNKKRVLLIFSILWLAIHSSVLRSIFLGYYPDGIAWQYLLGSYYQPCVFGILMLGGIFFYLKNQTMLSAFCFIVSPILHPTYLFSTGLITFVIIFIPINNQLNISWKKRLIFLGVVFTFIAIYGYFISNLLTVGDPIVRREAHLLLSKELIPFHSIPSEWSLLKTFTLLSFGFIASYLSRKFLIGQLLFGLLTVVIVSILYSHFYFDPTLALIAPWRVSVFIAPLSWIILLVILTKSFLKVLFDLTNYNLHIKALNKSCVIICIVFSIMGMVNFAEGYEKKRKRPNYAISSFLKSYHQKGNQYLVPLEEMEIRLESGIPVFVTRKSYPNKDSELLQWYERINLANSIYLNKDDLLEIKDLMLSNSITHIVWPNSYGNYPYEGISEEIYRDKNFSLWDMRFQN